MDKETKDRLKKIRKKQAELWVEVREIENEEWEGEHEDLEGKCFKTKTNYGHDDEDEIEEWYVYFKILKIDAKRQRLIVEEIEETTRSEIKFKIAECHSYIKDYDEITEEEYETARKILISKLMDGPSAYNTGKTW